MFSFIGRLWHDRRGGVAIEAAVILPIFALALAGSLEIGRALSQATAVQKGVRAGAIFASRHEAPLTPALIDQTRNVVRSLDPQGGASLVAGFDAADSSVAVTTHMFHMGSDLIPVVRVVASVPYDPLLPTLVDFAGLSGARITLSHEQVLVGQ